ncbi:uncharacterized protein BDV17DRAFT_288951 [Aspergillus undulatus]|uniref:uncharacterized protein n=1 Tax=Aspergillus undulatus TaxID=1810928 RepID=UPI003CCDAC87
MALDLGTTGLFENCRCRARAALSSYPEYVIRLKGTLSSLVLDELLQAEFTVSVLTRSAASIGTVPAGVTIKEVDYASTESLKAALTGHDVAIATLTSSAISLQKPVIDAVIEVGVKRFIPAEFGAMTSEPQGKKLSIHADAVEIQDYLAWKAEASELEYTAFAVGSFMHILFTRTMVVDFVNRAVSLYDNGEKPFSTSRLSTVAKAIVASLQKPDETRNRLVRVYDTVLTQRKVFELAKKWTTGENWTVTKVDAETRVQDVPERLQEGSDPALIMPLFDAALQSGSYGSQYKNVDNELLGLGFMGDQEFEEFGLGLVQL